ncbi:MAG: beta-hydroxyacyl-ACP dehydratase [bacterium]|nr:beta-hydroxyacyl-ACP dehydratase [bacterium]
MRFFLIDRISELKENDRATGIKNLTMSEDYFEHHFLFFPLMPGVLIVESMVQLASWLVSSSRDFSVFAVLQSLSDAKFRLPVQPGDTLTVQVQLKSLEESGMSCFGKITLQDKTVATAKFESALIAADEEEKRFLEKHYKFLTTRL